MLSKRLTARHIVAEHGRKRLNVSGKTDRPPAASLTCSTTHSFKRSIYIRFSHYVGSCTLQLQRVCDKASTHTFTFKLLIYGRPALSTVFSCSLLSHVCHHSLGGPAKSRSLKADSASSCRCDTWFICQQKQASLFPLSAVVSVCLQAHT